MEVVAPHASVIVPEVLKRNNYKRWSIFMQDYLMSQDLGDVVELSQLPAEGNMGREWIKKNALALHAIKISCGEEMFDQIKEMNSAKDVWYALADMHKPADQDIVEHPLAKRTGPGNLAGSQYETLIKAISDGELSKVKKFFRENSNAISAEISEHGYTALHLAVYNGQEEIVKYLIESNLSLEELEIKDRFGSTALSIAARYGIGESIAQKLVRKNQNLLTIPDNEGKIPVHLACNTIQEKMIGYLYRETPLESLKEDRGFYILQECITKKMFGISVKTYPIKGAKRRTLEQDIEDNVEDFYRSCLAIFLAYAITISIVLCLGMLILVALGTLVSMLSRASETHLYQLKLMDEYAREVIHLICHESFSKLDEIQFVQSKALEATFQAIKNGNPDIVKEIIKANANNELWCNKDPEDPSRNIFACAIAHRQEEVAHFLYESQKEKNMLFAIDEDGNNTLHLAAKLAPNYKSGYIYAAASQLQIELRWFKAVKEIVPLAYKEGKNKDNETPSEVFVREHKDLLKEAEEWVKKTAESSTVVGALIITIMFAVAFSVPGGNDQSTGFPVFLHKTPTPFMIFIVSDAISLFTASSSVIMFLGILTSHHSDEDYRKTFLLIIGLTSLFVSIATMTTAFCAALFIMLQGQGGLGFVIPVTLFAGIPIVCYVLLQFPLLVEIIGLTFSSNIFGKKRISSMIWTADMVIWGMRNLRG
ncbi:hypothetical protein SLEP1_g19085 [Rubroshorea leprosula]|nr:hypothetical protein SLEP1_g19085 [Rubroshorea leprosula]